MSLNKVMLIGNVGKEPSVRYLEGNAKVASFSLATTERYKDRNGEMKENTEWHNIVAWRNSADVVEKFVHKGTQLYIEGKLRTRKYNDQAGVEKSTTEIVVDTLQLLGRKTDNEQSSGDYSAPSKSQTPQYQAPTSQAPAFQSQAPVAPQPEYPSSNDNDSDDLPF